MISVFTSGQGKHWQCDKCKGHGGPFETDAEAKEAAKEHDCPHVHIEPPDKPRR